MIVIPRRSYSPGIGSAHSTIIESARSSGSGFALFVEGMGSNADPGDLVYATNKEKENYNLLFFSLEIQMLSILLCL